MNPANQSIDFLNILEKIRQAFVDFDLFRILFTLGLTLALVLANRFLVRLLNARLDDANRRHVFRKITNYTTAAIIVIAILFIWVQNLTFLTAVIGFIAAGLAIALRDVLMSLFGWVKIISAQPFGIGDRIQINEIEGDIIDISPLHTVLLEIGNWVAASQSTGRIVYIPNFLIFQQPVYNSTLGFPYLWDEFSVEVTFESDFDQAEDLLKEPIQEEIGINYKRARQDIRKLSNRYAIQYENLSPRVYTAVKDSGVELTLRYLTRSRGRREIKSRLSNKILTLLRDHPDVELAYPTYRIFRREVEQGDQSPSDPGRRDREPEE